jgi:hypothetical protein
MLARTMRCSALWTRNGGGLGRPCDMALPADLDRKWIMARSPWIRSLNESMSARFPGRASKQTSSPEIEALLSRVSAAASSMADLEADKLRLIDQLIRLAGNVGLQAADVFGQAITALARCPGSRASYLSARYNLGALLRDAGDFGAAEREWTAALADEIDLGDDSARFSRSVIEFNYAALLITRGEAVGDIQLIRKACDVYDILIRRERATTMPGTRDRVARALPRRVLYRQMTGPGDDVETARAAALQAARDMAVIADEWGSAELRARADELTEKLNSVLRQPAGPTADAPDGPDDAAVKEHREAMNAKAWERLEAHRRFGLPFVLLLRSFGRISVLTGSPQSIPTVNVMMPGISMGDPREAQAAQWLERRALVISVANPSGMLLDPGDAMPRLTLGADWFDMIQDLILRAAAIVIIATAESPGLRDEARAVEWMNRSADAVLITTGDISASYFGSFPHYFPWDGDIRKLDRNRDLKAILARLDKLKRLPIQQRLAAAESAQRDYYAAPVAHQQSVRQRGAGGKQ